MPHYVYGASGANPTASRLVSILVESSTTVLTALEEIGDLQDVVTRAKSYTNLNALSLFSGPRQRDVSANQGFYERPLQKPQMLGTSLISS
ncbi:UNVERIFIED_CONTAM: hypothetical protein FKN15_020641 [Acipenser sinensis]